MATIQANLTNLVNARKSIIKAINDKGVACENTVKLSGLPPFIRNINTSWTLYNTYTGNSVTLPVKPSYCVVAYGLECDHHWYKAFLLRKNTSTPVEISGNLNVFDDLDAGDTIYVQKSSRCGQSLWLRVMVYVSQTQPIIADGFRYVASATLSVDNWGNSTKYALSDGSTGMEISSTESYRKIKVLRSGWLIITCNIWKRFWDILTLRKGSETGEIVFQTEGENFQAGLIPCVKGDEFFFSWNWRGASGESSIMNISLIAE